MTLAVPGSKTTDPEDINTSGQVAGVYTDQSNALHGFIRSAAGAYTTYSFPAGKTNASVSINDAGEVAGYYYGSDYVFAGFVRDTNGTITTFTIGPATRTSVAQINQGGSVVGGYGGTRGLRRGYLRRPDGTTVSLEYPGANTITSTTTPSAINQSGVIIGYYQINTTNNTVVHGFILTGVQ